MLSTAQACLGSMNFKVAGSVTVTFLLHFSVIAIIGTLAAILSPASEKLFRFDMNKHMRRATFLLEKHKLTKHLSSLVWQCCVAADS